MNSALSDPFCKGSQVNPVAGACVLGRKPDLDFVLEGPLPLDWQRSYRSTNQREGWFGRGWGCALAVSLEVSPDPRGVAIEHMDYVDPFGRHIRFPRLEPGTDHYSPFERLTLRRSAQGVYSLETSDGVTYTFGERMGVSHALAGVHDRNGNRIDLTHQFEQGVLRAVQVRCSGGQTLLLRFENQRLAEVVAVRAQPVRLVRYTYSLRGDLAKVFNRLGDEVRLFEYNDDRLLTRQVHAGQFEAWYEYEGAGPGAKVVRSGNNVGQSWQLRYLSDVTEVTDHAGRVTRYHLDADRRWSGYSDQAGGFTRRGLDRHGNVRAIIDPAGLVTEASFDERGNPVELRDAAGAVTKVEWHPVFALPVMVTDPIGRVTAYRYDERGNLVGKTAPDGAETAYKLDERGLVVEIEDAKGGKKKQAFNAAGQLIRYTDCSNQTTTFDYDEEGNLVRITDALGQATVMSYDELGRVRRHTLADGSAEAYEYDLAGRVVSVTNAMGTTTRYRYGLDGQIEERIDALGQRLQYKYDRHRLLGALVNENGDAYRFAYDALDRLIAEERFDKTRTHFTYDLSGYLIETVEAPGHEQAIPTRYRRDAMGRLLERTTPASRALFAYDEAGQLILGQNAEVLVRLGYDKAGRLASEHTTLGSREHKLAYEYDPLGNRIQSSLPDGTVVSRLHYGDGHTHQILCDGAPVTDIERDALHREISRTQGRLLQSRQYDAAGRLSLLSSQASVPDVPGAQTAGTHIERSFSYDLAGRLVQCLDRGRTQSYQYDALDRLTRFNDEVYAFDPAHNLVDQAAAGGVVGRVEGNRVLVHEDKRYRYDAHGRVVEKRVGAHTTITLQWNDEHRLVGSTTTGPDGLVNVRYVNDAFGRRVAKLTEDGATLFAWEGNRLVQQQDAHGALTFIYESTSFVPLAQLFKPREATGAAPAMRYYQCDQVGLPRELTDAQGRIVWEAQFSGWGRVTTEQGDAQAQPIRYQGQYHDKETGLHYNRYRYYDPDIGRFVSSDPIGLGGGDNLYQYAVNPLTWIDPLGLVKFTPKTKGLILTENFTFHGTHTCEKCKCAVIKPKKSKRGETPPQNEWQIDHIEAESVGGGATECNGQVLCRKCNRADWDKPKPNYKEQNRAQADDDGGCE
ncbi:MAG TPA: RHS repeat-associated core domain-containing protein [Aquabacterium sp.]|uniref:RHS repeat-associated core domain-containing protein n=1 Tax=Aquabacterium sp. TaxID=1872578 RepID=UPI002E30382A|nr:RHS repeat-associated core domain-containing protein [Aquabacterium sp.]HEX5357229.1 RHS repeat-associated core domain-containing protein [Aquabacterium sp.]